MKLRKPDSDLPVEHWPETADFCESRHPKIKDGGVRRQPVEFGQKVLLKPFTLLGRSPSENGVGLIR
ncbi:MAG: hypothetical protein F4Z36_07155 [Acidimicrobiia bacterium]|nr:hypothetical protein [Acidimicrobiia bacterium]